MADLRRQVQEAEARHRTGTLAGVTEEGLREWRVQMERQIERFAEDQTSATLRHEGAHQLLYTYGVHSRHGIEGEWLIEGLAAYCETLPMGAVDPDRWRSLRQALEAGSLIGLEDLVNRQDPSGLRSFGTRQQIGLAYDQAWGLVHFLMQPARQGLFFAYLRYLRDPDHVSEICRAGQLAVLCRFLGVTPSELWRQWLEYLRHSPA